MMKYRPNINSKIVKSFQTKFFDHYSTHMHLNIPVCIHKTIIRKKNYNFLLVNVMYVSVLLMMIIEMFLHLLDLLRRCIHLPPNLQKKKTEISGFFSN